MPFYLLKLVGGSNYGCFGLGKEGNSLVRETEVLFDQCGRRESEPLRPISYTLLNSLS